MSSTWQLMLSWGVLVGTGSGFVAVVLAAAVVNRWFSERRYCSKRCRDAFVDNAPKLQQKRNAKTYFEWAFFAPD